jgi:orotidine-5'-phosphate decarboxylase
VNTEKVIVALDLDTPEEAIRTAETIAPIFPFFKIGMKLFTKAGPVLIQEVRRYGKVFLDLKFYDIPTVVADAVSHASQMGVSLLTLHASGGTEMMKRCADQIAQSSSSCKLLAVTVLTSLDSLEEFGVGRTIPDQVKALATMAHAAGMNGIVCSPAELPALRPLLASPFLLVTPGIRSATDERGDQKRIASASEAIRAGADYIVIGRPIVASPQPLHAAEKIAREIA